MYDTPGEKPRRKPCLMGSPSRTKESTSSSSLYLKTDVKTRTMGSWDVLRFQTSKLHTSSGRIDVLPIPPPYTRSDQFWTPNPMFVERAANTMQGAVGTGGGGGMDADRLAVLETLLRDINQGLAGRQLSLWGGRVANT